MKTGGLADAVGALPPALAEFGVATRCLVPGYPAVLEGLPDAAPGQIGVRVGYDGPLSHRFRALPT